MDDTEIQTLYKASDWIESISHVPVAIIGIMAPPTLSLQVNYSILGILMK